MPVHVPQAQRIQAKAFLTDTELRTQGENYLHVHVRERIRDATFDAIMRASLHHEDIPGGRKYWLDVLVLTPETLCHLVEQEALRLLKESGYEEA